MAALAVQCVVETATASGTANHLAHQPLWLGAPAALAAATLFVHGGQIVRVTLALLCGVLGTAFGIATSITHAALAGAAAADYTGAIATVGGLVLIALAFRLSLAGRRLSIKLILGALLVFALVQWGLIPAINAGVASHARHPTIPRAATLGLPGARDVAFSAADGTRLRGWYVPGRTGAAVILLHGSHGTRLDTVRYLRMLSAAGYGVLAYDARGHGSSGGRANALGWKGAQDLAAAVRFLRARPGLERAPLAALGLSMGGEEALRAAASGVGLTAVVADGAGAATQGDDELVSHGPAPIYASISWLTMREIELASGSTEPRPLKRIVNRIHVPVLLIASNAHGERTIDTAYRDRIGARAKLWYVPDAGHTRAFAGHPGQYRKRVIGFLQSTLGRV